MEKIYQILARQIKNKRLGWSEFSSLVLEGMNNLQFDNLEEDPEIGPYTKKSNSGNILEYRAKVFIMDTLTLDLSQVLDCPVSEESPISIQGTGGVGFYESLAVWNEGVWARVMYRFSDGLPEISRETRGLPIEYSQKIEANQHKTLGTVVGSLVKLYTGPALDKLK